MTVAAYAVRPGDPDYGHICACGAPKHRQSRRCQACYTDARRAGMYPDPPRMVGPANPQWKPSGHVGHRSTGRPSGRPQPQSHPWRGKNQLLFMKKGTHV